VHCSRVSLSTDSGASWLIRTLKVPQNKEKMAAITTNEDETTKARWNVRKRAARAKQFWEHYFV
jgi:hypothetical protein